MTLPRSPELEAALAQASDEIGLAEWYRDCVRPLLNMPETRWPRCCGRGCEPCADMLIAVAERVRELLRDAAPSAAPPDEHRDGAARRGEP
jgi:hypothetical protein